MKPMFYLVSFSESVMFSLVLDSWSRFSGNYLKPTSRYLAIRRPLYHRLNCPLNPQLPTGTPTICNYPFNFVPTTTTIPNSLNLYLERYHPSLIRLASPPRCPKFLQQEREAGRNEWILEWKNASRMWLWRVGALWEGIEWTSSWFDGHDQPSMMNVKDPPHATYDHQLSSLSWTWFLAVYPTCIYRGWIEKHDWFLASGR